MILPFSGNNDFKTDCLRILRRTATVIGLSFFFILTVSARQSHGLTETGRLLEIAEYALALQPLVAGEPVELEEILTKVGLDQVELARWVEENISFEPYNGIMKGPRGTLVSSRGNAADQAVLLATLLENTGISVKVVRGEVTASALPELIPAAWNGDPPEPTEKELAELAEKLGISRQTAMTQLYSAQLDRQSFLEDLWSRTMHDLEKLAATLQVEQVTPPKVNTANYPKGSSEETIEHWWIITDSGEFDPVLGTATGTAIETYSLRDIPEEMFHQLTVRMLIQRDEGDAENPALAPSETVLEITLKTAEMFGETLVLGNVPLDSAEALASLRNPTPENVIEALVSTTHFQPQLATPLGTFSGHPFDLEGNLLEVKAGQIEAVRDLGGAMWGLFAPSPTDEPAARLAAHWLELTLQPAECNIEKNREPLVIRRDILRHPDDPQGVLDLLATREMLIMADQISSEWLTRKTLQHAAEQAEQISRMFADPARYLNMEQGVDIEEFAGHPHLTPELYVFGLARRHEMRRLREIISPETVYWNQQPLVISHLRRLLRADDTHPSRMQAGLDILNNNLSIMGPSVDRWSEHLAFAAGILDTALELTINPALYPGDRRSNASLSMENALAHGFQPKLEQAEEKGMIRILVSAADPPMSAAWYQVCLTDGTSLGMMDGGGQAMTEYAQRVNIALQLRGILKFYADMFHCLGLALSMPLAMDPEEQQMKLADCVWDLACGKLKDLATSFTKVDVNWTNIILKRTVDNRYSKVCDGLKEQVLGR